MSVTVDTCVWISLEKEPQKDIVLNLLNLCVNRGIPIHVSSRFYDFDSIEMDAKDKGALEKTFQDYKVIVDANSFRLGGVSSNFGSRFGDGNFLGSAIKSTADTDFETIFGSEPMTLNGANTGRKLTNWIGDYDALKQHFFNKRDLFVTIDTKVYFSEDKRKAALEKLNLKIVSPHEAVKIIQETT